LTEEKKEPEKTVNLSWRDYVAIVIASFETTLLPFIIVIIVLLFLSFMLRR
jgi:hypothetical protein